MHPPGRTSRGSPARPNLGHGWVLSCWPSDAQAAREQGCRVHRCDVAECTAGGGLMRLDIPDARGAPPTALDDCILGPHRPGRPGGVTTPKLRTRSRAAARAPEVERVDGTLTAMPTVYHRPSGRLTLAGRGAIGAVRWRARRVLHFRGRVAHPGVHHAVCCDTARRGRADCGVNRCVGCS